MEDLEAELLEHLRGVFAVRFHRELGEMESGRHLCTQLLSYDIANIHAGFCGERSGHVTGTDSQQIVGCDLWECR